MDYGDAVFTGGIGVKAEYSKTEYTLGTRTLKKSAKGTDVKRRITSLQLEALLA